MGSQQVKQSNVTINQQTNAALKLQQMTYIMLITDTAQLLVFTELSTQ